MAGYLLNLKVMRLSRPVLLCKSRVLSDSVVEQGLPLSSTSEMNESQELNELGISHFLQLPTSFGNIYLGETFTSYLSINNDSQTPVADVSFKAELQTTSQRFTLANSNSGSASPRSSQEVDPLNSQTTLLPSQSSEFIINHEIKELGIHILVCSVHYTPSPSNTSISGQQVDRERKFFRKFYKFQVLNPLAVKTKVNTLPDNFITLETQIQNLCAVPMYLERMKFDQNPLFDFTDLNNEGQLIFGDSNLISPNDSRQYLFLLKPKLSTDLETRTTPNLGILDIAWNSTMGQKGKLQTSQLTRRVPKLDPFEITVVSITPEIQSVEQPFNIRVRIRNNCNPEEKQVFSVVGVKSKMSSILIYGKNEIKVGELKGQRQIDIDLSFFALLPGIHKVTGLKVVENLSQVEKEVECLAVVHVEI